MCVFVFPINLQSNPDLKWPKSLALRVNLAIVPVPTVQGRSWISPSTSPGCRCTVEAPPEMLPPPGSSMLIWFDMRTEAMTVVSTEPLNNILPRRLKEFWGLPFQHSFAMFRLRALLVFNLFWLVVDLPLWKIWKSVGVTIPDIWKNKKCSKPSTSICHLFQMKRIFFAA